MRLGCELEQARFYRRRFFWLGVVCLLLLNFIALRPVGAIPSAPQARYKTLFALSIEELINIRVDGAVWNGAPNEGTFVVKESAYPEGAERRPTPAHEQAVSAFVSELLPLRSLGTTYGGLAEAELSIDGYQSGRVGSFGDLVRYVQFFSTRLKRIELYFGESALVLSDGRAGLVINLVTEQYARSADEVKRVEASEL